MTTPRRLLDHRAAADGRRVRRPPARLLFILGSLAAAAVVFVAGLALFVWLDQRDPKPAHAAHVLRLTGAILCLPAGLAYGAAILLWSRHDERPFVAGLCVGAAVTFGLLAIWGMVL